MRITYLFLPLYFGLFAGLFAHGGRAGVLGAAVGLILAVLLSAEGKRRGRAGGMVAIDAMTDLNADAHHNSVTRIFPRLGESGTTPEIIALLDSTRA